MLAIIARYRTAVGSDWIDRLGALSIAHAEATDAIWVANNIFRGLAVRLVWDRDPVQFKRMEIVCERILLSDLIRKTVQP